MRTVNPYILLADDDPEDRQSFIDEFVHQQPGVAVQQAESGHELLHYLIHCPNEQLPTLLVLDYQMPDLNGPEVLQALAANVRYNKIVKIVWSSSQRTKDREECKHLGATHYLVKPGTIDELKKAIQQLVAILSAAAHHAPDAK